MFVFEQPPTNVSKDRPSNPLTGDEQPPAQTMQRRKLLQLYKTRNQESACESGSRATVEPASFAPAKPLQKSRQRKANLTQDDATVHVRTVEDIPNKLEKLFAADRDSTSPSQQLLPTKLTYKGRSKLTAVLDRAVSFYSNAGLSAESTLKPPRIPTWGDTTKSSVLRQAQGERSTSNDYLLLRNPES